MGKKKFKKPSKGIVIVGIIVFGVFAVWYIQYLENNSDTIVEYTQDGDVVRTDFRDQGQNEQLETIEQEPTECLEPKASDMVEGPAGWETLTKTVNSDESDYNYVRYRSPDYRYGTSVEGVRGIVEGGEITFIVTCDSDFTTVEQLVAYEKAERVFKNTDQTPSYIPVAGQTAVQYYFGYHGDSPLLTVMFKDGRKYTLQYSFPQYDGDNQEIIDELAVVRADYIQRYIEVLDTINLP